MTTTTMIPISEIQQLATATARSGFFAGVETPDKALVLMAIAQAEGCAPIQAMQRYHIIKGKPSKQAWAMLADFTSAGGKVEWHEHSSKCCKATFSHPAGGTVTVDWDLEKARGAGLSGNDNWRKYPENMLHARVVSNGVRFVYPAAANGLYTPEEVEDFDKPFASLPAEKKQEPVLRAVEKIDGSKPKKTDKWTPQQPIPSVILSAIPGAMSLADRPLQELETEDLEMVLEQGKQTYSNWSEMPGASKKALSLLREITITAQTLLDERQGLVPPQGAANE